METSEQSWHLQDVCMNSGSLARFLNLVLMMNSSMWFSKASVGMKPAAFLFKKSAQVSALMYV